MNATASLSVEPVGDHAAAPVAPSSTVSPADMTAVMNRVKRAQGQLGGVLRMLEEARDVSDVVVQLKAVSRALDRAGFAIISADLRRQVAGGDAVNGDDLDRLERWFLSLA